MKPARLVVLAIAIAAAGGSAFIAKGMIGGNEQPIEVAAPQLNVVDVLIAGDNVNMGQSIKADALSWQSWPKDAIRSGFITKEDQPDALTSFTGKLANAPILSGEPINTQKLVMSEGSGFMSIVLPKGKRAISIEISPETGAGGFILPNNRVDVIQIKENRDIGREGGVSTKFAVETVLRNVMIRAIDQAWAEKDGNQVLVGKTATLELTPEQTETLALAQAEGQLTLALRSLRDSDPAQVEETKKRRKAASVSILSYGKRTTISQH